MNFWTFAERNGFGLLVALFLVGFFVFVGIGAYRIPPPRDTAKCHCTCTEAP